MRSKCVIGNEHVSGKGPKLKKLGILLLALVFFAGGIGESLYAKTDALNAPAILAEGEGGAAKYVGYGTPYELQELTDLNISEAGSPTMPVTEVIDGQDIYVEFKYKIASENLGSSASGGTNQVTYKLPAEVAPSEVKGGPIMDGLSVIGEFKIDTDGLVTLVFDKNIAGGQSPVNGSVRFLTKANKSGEGESQVVEFRGTDKTLTINKKPAEKDIAVTKKRTSFTQGETSVTGQYEVLVSTTEGTPGPVNIEDKMEWGSAKSRYENIKLWKIPAGEGAQPVEVTDAEPVLSQDSGHPNLVRFKYSNLPALEAGEKYKLTYDLVSDKSDFPSDSDPLFQNKVDAVSGDKNANASTRHTLSRPKLDKNGNYDARTDFITWTIKIDNSDPPTDLAGYNLKDALPSELAGAVPTEVSLKTTRNGQDDDSRNLSSEEAAALFGDGWTLPEGSDAQKYELTFKTKVPASVSSGTKLINKVDLSKDNESFHKESEVWVNKRKKDLEKTWKEEQELNPADPSTKKYLWNAKITLADDWETFTFRDYFYLKNTDGTLSASPHHYADKAELDAALKANMIIELENNTSVSLENSEVPCEFIYYSDVRQDESTVIAADDTETPVKSFAIKFTRPETLTNNPTAILLNEYPSRVSFSEMADNETRTFLNKASAQEIEKTAENAYTKQPRLNKVAKSGYNNFTALDQEASFNDKKIEYRIILKVDKDSDDPIVFTDLLPKGMSLTEVGDWTGAPKMEGFFYQDQYTMWGDRWGGGQHYIFAKHLSFTEETQDDGRTKLTVTVGGGHKDFLEDDSIMVHYVGTFADDSDWDSYLTSEKHYKNEVQWGEEKKSVDVKITRDVKKVEKKAEQLPLLDAYGNPVVINGEVQYSKRFRYRIVINPQALQLNGGNPITLQDKVTLPDGVFGSVDITTVKLHYFDDTAADKLGREVNRSLYSMSIDPAARTFSLTAPDEKGYVLTYEYEVDRGTIAHPMISNEASLSGGYKDSISEAMKHNDAEAIATAGRLYVYKVDSETLKPLPGTKFKLYAYEKQEDGSFAWNTEGGMDIQTDSSGQMILDIDNEQSEYIVRHNASRLILRPDSLYQLTETEPLPGYRVDEPNFYFIRNAVLNYVPQTNEQSYQAATGKNSAEAVQNKDGDELAFGDISFVPSQHTLRHYVRNVPVGLRVDKIWTGRDGQAIAPQADEVKVQLYQKEEGGQSMPYGDPVTLNEANAWHYIWDALPDKNPDTEAAYSYYVEEIGIEGAEYEIEYVNNNGIKAGTITINNKFTKFKLPATGGIGTKGFTAAGLGLCGISGLMFIKQRKRRKKEGY